MLPALACAPLVTGFPSDGALSLFGRAEDGNAPVMSAPAERTYPHPYSLASPQADRQTEQAVNELEDLIQCSDSVPVNSLLSLIRV